MSVNQRVSTKDEPRPQDAVLLSEELPPQLNQQLRSPTNQLLDPCRQVDRDEDLEVGPLDRAQHREVAVGREFVAEEKMMNYVRFFVNHKKIYTEWT